MGYKRRVKWTGFKSKVPEIVRKVIPPYLFRNFKEICLYNMTINPLLIDPDIIAITFLERGEVYILEERLKEELGEKYNNQIKRALKIIRAIGHEFGHRELENREKIYHGPYKGNIIYHNKVEEKVEKITEQWEKTFEKNYGKKIEEVLTKSL
jgi:hypothetical protein